MSNPFILAEDAALKAHLSGIVVRDEASSPRSVLVRFGYPDVEVADQKFPFITIDLIDVMPANNRQTSGRQYDNDYQGTTAPSDNTSYAYDIPVAYDLSYQVTAYSRHPRHDRALMLELFRKFPSKYGKLPVPNQLGTETANRSMFLDGFVKRDAVDGETGNRRLYRNVYSVRILSEMSPSLAAEALTSVRTVDITTTPYTPTV